MKKKLKPLDRRTLLRLRSDLRRAREEAIYLMRNAVTQSTSDAYRYRALGLFDAIACIECRLVGKAPRSWMKAARSEKKRRVA